MRPFTFLCLLAIIAALPQSQAAPAPKRTNAKPAVIKAGTEQYVQGFQLRVVSYAHIAILRDKKAVEWPIVRRHLHDPKDSRELISWLEKNFRVERVKGTKLVRVSFQDGNAEEQAAIINVVVDFYLKERFGRERDHSTEIFKRQIMRIESEAAAGRLTPAQAAKQKEAVKKQYEEWIRPLPVLIEPAKAR